MSRESASSTGLSFGAVLFFIFLVMKLMHYIDWSWWWVTAPLWLPLVAFLSVMAAIVLVSWICIAVSVMVIAICNRGKSR